MSRGPEPVSLGHAAVLGDFFDGAAGLRTAFDQLYQDRLSLDERRFFWDYWYVPEYFTFLRAMPEAVFPERLYQAFLDRLRALGRSWLGCRELYLPTLNCHVEGCWHNLHTDADKGPWAYVYSLTTWANRGFSGGETNVLNASVLDYWHDLAADGRPISLFEVFALDFNQLLVFEARLPHSVARVSGTHDPARARLTMAGWFGDPGVTASPAVEAAGVVPLVESAFERVNSELASIGDLTGTIVVRAAFDRDGLVGGVVTTADTLVATGDDRRTTEQARRLVREALIGLELPPVGEPGWVTVPFALSVGT